jgi:hypothetical protein
MSHWARLFGTALGGLAVACAGAPDTTTTFLNEAVVGGEASGASDDFVVRVTGRETRPLDDISCSGTLLAPNLLMTALMCVAVFEVGAAYSCESDGSLQPGNDGGWIGETLDPERVEVSVGTTLPPVVMAHGTRVLGTGSTVACIDDIAFVVLDTDLPVRKIPVRIDRPVLRGELMTVIGYGQTDIDGVPRARRSGVPVLDVGPDDTSGPAGTAAPRTFTVGDGPCPGDNGAPALSDETGAATGVFFRNFSGNCLPSGTRGSFMKLSPYAALLRRAFEEAGQEPLLEGESPTRAPARARAHGSCALGAGSGAPASWVPALFALLLFGGRRRAARARHTRRDPRS